MNSMSSRLSRQTLGAEERDPSRRPSDTQETKVRAVPSAGQTFAESATSLNLCATTDHARPLLDAFEGELNNALSIVNGFGELLLVEGSGRLTPGQRDCLTSLLQACQRARDVTDGFVFVTRADRGASRLQFAPHGVLSLVEHVVRGASWAALEAGASVRMLPISCEATVDCDVRALNRVLRDVLRVLIQAGGSGAEVVVQAIVDRGVVVLTLTCQPGDEPGDRAMSDVTLRAWRRTLVLHGGALQMHLDTLSARVVLPLLSALG
jgi:signal transduction histidine kinase